MYAKYEIPIDEKPVFVGFVEPEFVSVKTAKSFKKVFVPDFYQLFKRKLTIFINEMQKMPDGHLIP